jgi:ribose transport system substrate-binding protein
MGRSMGLAASLVLGLGVLGCSGGEKAPEAGTQAGASGMEAKLGGDGKLTIAVIGKSSTNPVFLSARTGAEAAAAELSKKYGVPIEVAWLTPPQEDGQVQAQRVTQAVNEGADAVLLSSSDEGKVRGSIDDAVARGVAVMTFDSDVPDSKRFTYYGVDDVKTGETVMAELAKAIGGKGNVAILAGNQNAPNLQSRVRGVQQEAAKYPGIKIVGVFNHIETPQDAAAEVIRVKNAYPSVNAWAMVGGWALFTTSLLDGLDPKLVTIVSVDGLPAELPYVETGLAPVLLAQPTYEWGHLGVTTIVEHVLDGKEFPERIPMTLVKVTKDNLGEWARQLKEWGFTDVPEKYLQMQ